MTEPQPAKRIGRGGFAAAMLAGCLVSLTAAGEPAPVGTSRSWLGVLVRDAVDGGAQVVALVPDGPAERAGLLVGDVVVRAGEQPVTDGEVLEPVLGRLQPGEQLRVLVLRAGRPLERVVLLGRRATDTWFATPTEPTLPPAPPGGPAPAPRHDLEGLRVADVTPALRAHFGAPEDAGVLVTRIERGLAADAAGIRVGDLLVRAGSQPVDSVAQLDRLLAEQASHGGPLELTLVRARQVERATLAAREGALQVPHAADPGGPAGLEQALAAEIERLERRVELLRRKLEQLRQER